MYANKIQVFILIMAMFTTLFALVQVRYEYRQKIRQLYSLREEAKHQQVQYTRLLLEKSTLESYGKVEHVAIHELNMHIPNPQDIWVFDKVDGI